VDPVIKALVEEHGVFVGLDVAAPALDMPQRRDHRRAADRPAWMDRVSPRSPA
jgi:hypothetical protein